VLCLGDKRKDLGIEGRIIFKWIIQYDRRTQDFSGSEMGLGERCCDI